MRLFLAIQFDEPTVRALTEFQEKLRAFGMRGRFASPENLHLTLAFIGEYAAPDAVMDAFLKDAALTADPFSVRTCRNEMYARGEDGTYLPLDALGESF